MLRSLDGKMREEGKGGLDKRCSGVREMGTVKCLRTALNLSSNISVCSREKLRINFPKYSSFLFERLVRCEIIRSKDARFKIIFFRKGGHKNSSNRKKIAENFYYAIFFFGKFRGHISRR